MKNKLLLTITIFLFSLTLMAQTTEEEYNYITKGYKVQIESGLDMKKGYEMEKMDGASAGERRVELYKLLRVVAGKKTIAAYMIIYNREGAANEYLCLPNPASDKEITSKYWDALYGGTGDSSYRLKLISYILANNLKW